MIRWEIEKIWVHGNSFAPKLKPNWEPFAIEPSTYGCYIWIRKKSLNKRKGFVG